MRRVYDVPCMLPPLEEIISRPSHLHTTGCYTMHTENYSRLVCKAYKWPEGAVISSKNRFYNIYKNIYTLILIKLLHEKLK